MVSARSFSGRDVLENIRVRVTLKKPSKERAKYETEKQNQVKNETQSISKKENTQNEVSYTFVCKLLPHVMTDKAVSISGEHLILRDSQVWRLCREKTLFQYEVEIFELIPPGYTGLLTRPGFAAHVNEHKKTNI